MTQHYLGIDIGGTASRWAVADDDGQLVARGEARGATGHLFNPEARAEFANAIAEIAHAYGATGTIGGARLGVTGLGPMAYDDAKDIVGTELGITAARIETTDDMELAFHAVFRPGEGHIVSAGTGSIGLHVAKDGRTVRVGGRGILIDDGGAGAWIALEALNAVYRRMDERGDPGDAHILARELFTVIGGDSWDEVRAHVYGGDRGRIGALARPVAKAAEKGDPVAADILERTAGELARLGLALVGRTQKLPIAYIGRVLTLNDAIKPALLKALEGHDIHFPTIDAAEAAATLARESALNDKDTTP